MSNLQTQEREETFTGPYSYLSMTFAEQNAALRINSPLEAGYRPGASYVVGTRGTVKVWERPELDNLD